MNEIMRVNGTPLTVRPIEITDVQRLARMFKRLSPESVRFRFFAPLPRLRWPVLLRLADVDHCQRDALVALDGDEIVAVARYNALANPELQAVRKLPMSWQETRYPTVPGLVYQGKYELDGVPFTAVAAASAAMGMAPVAALTAALCHAVRPRLNAAAPVCGRSRIAGRKCPAWRSRDCVPSHLKNSVATGEL